MAWITWLTADTTIPSVVHMRARRVMTLGDQLTKIGRSIKTNPRSLSEVVDATIGSLEAAHIITEAGFQSRKVNSDCRSMLHHLRRRATTRPTL